MTLVKPPWSVKIGWRWDLNDDDDDEEADDLVVSVHLLRDGMVYFFCNVM